MSDRGWYITLSLLGFWFLGYIQGTAMTYWIMGGDFRELLGWKKKPNSHHAPMPQ